MESKKYEIKPCPKCGGKKIGINEECSSWIYSCGIGCLNIDCEQGMIIRYAFNRERAFNKALKAWNTMSGEAEQ